MWWIIGYLIIGGIYGQLYYNFKKKNGTLDEVPWLGWLYITLAWPVDVVMFIYGVISTIVLIFKYKD